MLPLWPVRVRQIDIDEPSGMPWYPYQRRYILNNTDVSKMEDDFLAEIRNRKLDLFFQTFTFCPGILPWKCYITWYMEGPESWAWKNAMETMTGRLWRQDESQTNECQETEAACSNSRALVNNLHYSGGWTDGDLDSKDLSGYNGSPWRHPQKGEYCYSGLRTKKI